MRALVREWGLVMGFWWWLGESFRLSLIHI